MFSSQARGVKTKILFKNKLPQYSVSSPPLMFGFYLSLEEGNSLLFSSYYLAEILAPLHCVDEAIPKKFRQKSIFVLFHRMNALVYGF